MSTHRDVAVTTRIESIAAYAPEQRVSTADLISQMAAPPFFDLVGITGIEHRRVRAQDEDSFTMALEAAKRCIEASSYQPDQLDAVVSCSISRFRGYPRYHFEPALSLMLARELGVGQVIHFDVTNACAGLFTGMYALNALLRAGMIRRGLAVSGELITPISDTAVREIDQPFDPQFASLTVGDAASAVILDDRGDHDEHIDYLEMSTGSDYAKLCLGMPSDKTAGPALYTDNTKMHNRERMALWTDLHGRVLRDKGCSFADEGFDLVIHHQIGSNFMDKSHAFLGKHFDAPVPPLVKILGEYGNTASTSHILALDHHLRRQPPDGPIKVLMIPAASGIVVGSMSVRIDPARMGYGQGEER
jgi:3-oxoacyl-[acyl-carrier-protein] synthase III